MKIFLSLALLCLNFNLFAQQDDAVDYKKNRSEVNAIIAGVFSSAVNGIGENILTSIQNQIKLKKELPLKEVIILKQKNQDLLSNSKKSIELYKDSSKKLSDEIKGASLVCGGKKAVPSPLNDIGASVQISAMTNLSEEILKPLTLAIENKKGIEINFLENSLEQLELDYLKEAQASIKIYADQNASLNEMLGAVLAKCPAKKRELLFPKKSDGHEDKKEDNKTFNGSQSF